MHVRFLRYCACFIAVAAITDTLGGCHRNTAPSGRGLLYTLGGKLVKPRDYRGLRFRIIAESNAVPKGVGVVMQLVFKNVGSKPLTILHGYWGQPIVSAMVVYGPGIKTPARPTKAGIQGEVSPSALLMCKMMRWRLKPGQSIQVAPRCGLLAVNHYFHMTAPGTYYIQLHFEDAISNICQVTIQP